MQQDQGRSPVCLIQWTLLAAAVLFATAAAAGAERLTVSVDEANIRSGPGTDYQRLWRVEKYTPLEIIEKQDKWYFFKDFEGTRGWIYADLVDDIDAVITKKGKINIRSGPSTNDQVAFQAEAGVPFKVLDRKGKWFHIRHADGDEGWIYETLVW
ncbi:MAG: SH3 domain-containing protein [Thermodesulfobacteriota bacterium]